MKRPTRTKLCERRCEAGNFVLTGWPHAATNPGAAELARIQIVTATSELWRVRLPRRPPRPTQSGPRDLAAQRCHLSPALRERGEGWRVARRTSIGRLETGPTKRGVESGAGEIVGRAPATQVRHFTVDSPIYAHSHDVVAQKGRFCATLFFARKFCVSPPRVRAFGDLQAISGVGAAFGESRKRGDSSAGLNWGSGEQRSLAVTSRSLKKLRICAMSDR